MGLTLSDRYEASIRKDNDQATSGGRCPYADSLVGQRMALLEEIDALRQLPVIDVCNHCKFMDLTHNVCTNCEEGETPRPVMCLQPVPSWCPLRGAR